MPIFINISQQPFKISCHMLTCMAKKCRKQCLNPWYFFYYISTDKAISLRKLQFHSYHQLVLVPACTTCLLFLPVLAASVTCFSADINPL